MYSKVPKLEPWLLVAVNIHLLAPCAEQQNNLGQGPKYHDHKQ